MTIPALILALALTPAELAESMEKATASIVETWQDEQEISTDSTVEAEASVKVELTVGWEIIAIVAILVVGSVTKKAIDD